MEYSKIELLPLTFIINLTMNLISISCYKCERRDYHYRVLKVPKNYFQNTS